MPKRTTPLRDSSGYAVVEATILFPIIIMIFAALVLLSMYLPTRAGLQRATQFAATALATSRSDTWLKFDENELKYVWTAAPEPKNVYAAVFESAFDSLSASDAESTVRRVFQGTVVQRSGAEVQVECELHNYLIYKEIVVTATQTIPMPVNLSFIGFPQEIPITVSSTAVAADGDEVVRDLDIAADFVSYIWEKYKLDNNAFVSAIRKGGQKISDLLGI